MASNNNSVNFMTNYKYRLKSNLKLMIVIAILHFFGAPVNLINFMVYGLQQRKLEMQQETQGLLEYNSANFNEWYPVIGVLTTIAALICGFIVIFNVFNYLYKRQNVDMILSLPMSSKTRFWSDFSAALTIYVGPFILNSVIALILSSVMNGIFAEELKETGSLLGVLSDETIFFGDFFTTILPLVLLGIGVMLFLFTMTLIVTVCCGSLFESIAYSLGIHILIPLTITGIGLMLFMNAYGINPFYEIVPALEVTSPLGIIGGFAYRIFDALEHESGAGINLAVLKFTLVPLVISAVLSVASYFLYIRRKAESTGKPFVYKTLYYIVITSVTLCIGSFMLGPVYNLFLGYGDRNIFAVMLVPFIINTAIAYLIMEVITNRGFKKFGKSVIKYVITIVATVAIILTSEMTHGFGVANHVPGVASVKSVSLHINGNYEQRADVEIKDDEGIKLITELHREIIKNPPKNVDYGEEEAAAEIAQNGSVVYERYLRNNIYVDLTYTKNIGGTVVREYDEVEFTPEIAAKLDELMNSTVYNKALVESMRKELKTTYFNSVLALTPCFEKKIVGYGSENLEGIMEFKHSDNAVIKAEKRKEANKLFDAINKDIEAHDVDGKNVNTGKMLYCITYTDNPSKNSVYIYDDYVNTIEFLKEHNVNLNISEESYENVYGKIAVYPPEISRLFPQDDIIYSSNVSAFVLLEDREMIKAVLDNLKPYSKGNENNGDYTVVVNEMRFSLDRDKKNLISSHLKPVEDEISRLAKKYNYKGGSGTVTLGIDNNTMYAFNNETEFGAMLYRLLYDANMNKFAIHINYNNTGSETLTIDSNSDRVGYISVENGDTRSDFHFVGKESFDAVYKKLYNLGCSVQSIVFINYDGIQDEIGYWDSEPVLDLDRYNGKSSAFGKDDLSGWITADDTGAEWLFTGYREYCSIIDEMINRNYNGYSVKYNDSQGEPLHYELNYDDIMANYNHYRDGNTVSNANTVKPVDYNVGNIIVYNNSGDSNEYSFKSYDDYCNIVDELVNMGIQNYTVKYDGINTTFGFSLNFKDREMNYANYYIPGNN